MNKVLLFMVAGFFSGIMITRAEKPRVTPPLAVRSAFDSRFPDAKVKQWSERRQGQKDTYTASFRMNGKTLFAYYDADGTWEGTGMPLKWSKDLPANVRTAWRKSDYASWKIMDLKKIRTADRTLYQLHLNNSLEDHSHDFAMDDECKLIYDDSGKLVSREVQ